MGVIFDIFFDIALHYRASRWIVAIVLSAIGLWYGGFFNPSTWIFVAIVAGLALLFEAVDHLLSRNRAGKSAGTERNN